MIENRKILRVVLAAVLSLLVLSGEWFFNSEKSPFYWYFLAHPLMSNLYRVAQIVPYLIGVMASGNPHGLNMVIFLVTAFAQWFLLMYLLSKPLLRLPVWVIAVSLVMLFCGVGLAAWRNTEAPRSSANAQTTRFKELRFGLTKEEARQRFGSPDLETDKPSVTRYGKTYKWTDFHAFWGPTSDRMDELTSVRWIYFHQGANTFHEDEERSQGLPGKWDMEIGFDREGRILWFNRIVGTTGPEVDPTRLK